jgi:hypothetical protein
MWQLTGYGRILQEHSSVIGRDKPAAFDTLRRVKANHRDSAISGETLKLQN